MLRLIIIVSSLYVHTWVALIWVEIGGNIFKSI
jgi:hypothetical protein